MENNKVHKIPIDYYIDSDATKANIKNVPYFYLKWSSDNKRYRVSASFKYLNKTYGLKINIVRECNKDFNFMNKIASVEVDTGLTYTKYIDDDNQTEIFLIERVYGHESNKIMLFFSLRFWNIDDYLDYIKG